MARRKGKNYSESFINKGFLAFMNPQSPIAAQYRAIRNNIRYASLDQPCRSIAITSPNADEGKTTTAVNIAVSMAQRGDKVLIIDANYKTPAIHDLFNTNIVPGLTNVLARQSALKEAIVTSKIGKLDILPLGSLLYNTMELLDSQVMTDILDIVTKQYDCVIIDTAPVLEAMDTNALASKCDGVILVVKARKTKKEAILKTQRELEYYAKATIIGVILNKRESS